MRQPSGRRRRKAAGNDSGGPVIHDGVIVAVNSFILNSNCQGAGFGYRVDTQYAQDFINAND